MARSAVSERTGREEVDSLREISLGHAFDGVMGKEKGEVGEV